MGVHTMNIVIVGYDSTYDQVFAGERPRLRWIQADELNCHSGGQEEEILHRYFLIRSTHIPCSRASWRYSQYPHFSPAGGG